MSKRYKLWFWNPWDFGRWIFQGEGSTIEELIRLVRGRPSVTYKITQGNEIVKHRKAASHWWRPGMVEPKDLLGTRRIDR